MRIAICSRDMKERYDLSRMVETALLRYGIIPKMSLFPWIQELEEESVKNPFCLAFLSEFDGYAAVKKLCSMGNVILLGKREDSAKAFESGAFYFLEQPVTAQQLSRSLERHVKQQKEIRNEKRGNVR